MGSKLRSQMTPEQLERARARDRYNNAMRKSAYNAHGYYDEKLEAIERMREEVAAWTQKDLYRINQSRISLGLRPFLSLEEMKRAAMPPEVTR